MIKKSYLKSILTLGAIGSIALLLLLSQTPQTANAFAETQATVKSDPNQVPVGSADSHTVPQKVIAYYFHTNSRCSTCKKIEAYSREAIETSFPNELKDGRLEFQMVNYEKPQNRHFMKDYKLVTKSLVLVKLVNGKQTKWTNLKLVWQLTGHKDSFLNYVRGEVRSYLSN